MPRVSPIPTPITAVYSAKRGDGTTLAHGCHVQCRDPQRDSHDRFARIIAIEPLFFIARITDSPESLEFPIRANHATKRGYMRYGAQTL